MRSDDRQEQSDDTNFKREDLLTFTNYLYTSYHIIFHKQLHKTCYSNDISVGLVSIDNSVTSALFKQTQSYSD